MNLDKAIAILALTHFEGLEELKRKFHELAHCTHPDKNPDSGDAARFRSVREAYEFCLDHLDELHLRFGSVRRPEALRQAPLTQAKAGSDVFEEIFGFSKSGRILGYQEPQVIYLSLSEFCFGVSKRQKLVAYQGCAACSGIGAVAGTPAHICRHCFGQGVIVREELGGKHRRDCPRCLGRGREVKSPCAVCDGFGRLRRFHRQQVDLPVGMRPHELYALESFDLVIKKSAQIFVEPRLIRDPIFQIENYDLLCEYHLDLARLTKTLNLRLTTPFGQHILTISVGAKSGDVITVAGAGLYTDPGRKTRGSLKVALRHRRRNCLRRLFSRASS